MLHTKTFTGAAGVAHRAIPAPPDGKLTDALDYGVACTEVSAGGFTVTLDDSEFTHWYIFESAANPTDWDEWVWQFNLDQGALTEQYDTATLVDSFNRFAVTGSGVTPDVYTADIGIAVSGSGNTRQWEWTVATKDCVLFRSDVPDGTDRWVIEWDGLTFFLGPTVASPLGTYTKQSTASTVTLAKKQIASKAWRFKKDSLSNVTLLVAAGVVTLRAPVSPTGTIPGPILAGDDYLVSNSRALEWYVDPMEYDLEEYVFSFAAERKGISAWSVIGTSTVETVDGEEKWKLTFELPASVTSDLSSGRHVWSVKSNRDEVITTIAIGSVQVMNAA
jgi:hypothetical protein